MATVQGRTREAKLARMLEARKRWDAHSEVREEGLSKIKKHGVGAADTAKRQAEYSAREAAKAVLGRGIRFQERQLGAWNPVEFAPSVQAEVAARPVARIVTAGGPEVVPQGIATGFLIGHDLLLTNHHVFSQRSDVSGYEANFFYVKDEKGINRGKHFEFDPARFFVSDAALDFAIVALKPRAREGDLLERCGCTRLIEATGKVLTGLPVNIIQHPNGGPRAFAISDNRLLEILREGFLHYEADTAEGSSGSPVFNSDWELVGLHHSGVPAMKGGEICNRSGGIWDPRRDLDDDILWIANEGTRVSFIVDRLRQLEVQSHERPILDALLAQTTDPVAAIPGTAESRPMNSFPISGAGAMSGINFNFSGPVTINIVQTGAPVTSPTATTAGAQADFSRPASVAVPEAEEKALVFDLDYAARDGYDRKFLGIDIAPPEMTGALASDLYTVGDYQQYFNDYDGVPKLDVSGLNAMDPLELKYHHFSLVQHKTLRMCAWTASNYDYRAASRLDGRKRQDFGGESWREDPRVPIEFQLRNNDVYGPARRVDRGHLVRREDNCWGEPGRDTEYANSDTYHWTNCAPQHEAFNQENPKDKPGQQIYKGTGVKGMWGYFERMLADQVELAGGKAVLFAGPVLTSFFEAEDWGRGKIKIPKKFWKVVVVRESKKKNSSLLAYGFVFDQSGPVQKYGLTDEALELPEFTRQHMSMQEISDLTGIRFAPAVMTAAQPDI